MKVGFTGLGRMGQGMAGRILHAGHELRVYHPQGKNLKKLEESGAQVAETIEDLASERDVIISMLPHDAALDSVVNGDGGLLESMADGVIHMAMGTHGVNQIRQVNRAHLDLGQVFIAAPVLGRPDLAATGQLSIVPAGPPDAVKNMRPLFEAMGKQIFEAGEDPKTSTAVKIANNFMIGCAIEMMGEAFSLVRKLGVSPQLFFEVMTKGLFDAPTFNVYGSMIAEERWDSYGATAVIGLKDAELVIEAAESAGMSMPSVHVWRDHLAKAIERGEGSLDWAVMAREHARECGLE